MDKSVQIKKNVRNILITIVLILAIPVLIYLVQQTQIFKPKAAGEPILFTGPNVIMRNNTQKLKLDASGNASVGIVITSPLGPAAP
jgi:hypothetical protein